MFVHLVKFLPMPLKTEKRRRCINPNSRTVLIHTAFSKGKVSVTSSQITKSVSSDGDGTKKGSDTMGMKHRVDDAIYVFYGR